MTNAPVFWRACFIKPYYGLFQSGLALTFGLEGRIYAA